MTTQAETSKAERLSYCEQTIALGKQTFLDVGNALAEIMEEQLYKLKGYGSFAEYCDKEWGFKKTYAYQLVASYKAVEPHSAIAENINEATARELAKVEPSKRAAVIKQAAATGKVTAASIKAAAVQPSHALSGIDVSKLDGVEINRTKVETDVLDSVAVARENLSYIENCINGHSCQVDMIAEVVKQLGELRAGLMQYQKEISRKG